MLPSMKAGQQAARHRTPDGTHLRKPADTAPVAVASGKGGAPQQQSLSHRAAVKVVEFLRCGGSRRSGANARPRQVVVHQRAKLEVTAAGGRCRGSRRVVLRGPRRQRHAYCIERDDIDQSGSWCRRKGVILNFAAFFARDTKGTYSLNVS